MTSKANPESGKAKHFSRAQVKALLLAVGIGIVLGVAVEVVDSALPKQHKMSAISDALFKGREARKKTNKSSYDMERPDVGFSVTE